MNALQLAVDFIAQWEGCKLTPYLCTGGVWTIGYGATRIDGRRVTTQTPRMTGRQALDLLHADVARFQADVRELVKVDLKDNELAALTSFAFNVGVLSLASSTLLARLNAGERGAAADQFKRWNISGGKVTDGLVNRRRAERALFDGLLREPPPGRRKMSLTPEAWLSETEKLNAASLARSREASGDTWPSLPSLKRVLA